MASFVITRRVEFFDTDMAGIVHFANYYRFMEEAEHELFLKCGLKIVGFTPDGKKYGWPRVASRCTYFAPATYDDVIEIHVRIAQRTAKALTTAYEFRRGETLLAEGDMTTVYCVFPPGEKMQSAPMTDEIIARLDAAK
jgi:YbgC/YbaW family acyl-CoA thioester hydrolase